LSIPVDVMGKTLTRDKGHKRILSHSRLEKSDYRNVGFLKKPLSENPVYWALTNPHFLLEQELKCDCGMCGRAAFI
jgi:hypothetical protein